MNIDEAIRIALLETALEVALEQRDAALVEAERSRAELQRVLGVVEAARAWRARIDDDGPDRPEMWADEQDFALIAAVDALKATETPGRQVPDA